MRIGTPVWWSDSSLRRLSLSLLLLLTAGTPCARADLLFFKDGFAIEGKVMREVEVEFDKIGRDAYYIPKGFFYLSDGPRRIFFSPSQVRYVFEKDPPADEKIFRKNPRRGQMNPKKFPGLLAVVKSPVWDDTWSRNLDFLSGRGAVERQPQHIVRLSPYWAEAESLGTYFWSCAYLTRELGSETIRSLLAMHPDFQDNKDQATVKRASMRLRKADFFAQAGWLDLADKELDRIIADMPDQKERAEAARKTLWKLRAADRIEDIKRRHLAGQHNRVRKLLKEFSPQGATKEQIARIEELEHEYKATDELIVDTARLLEKTRKEARGASAPLLREAGNIILGELNFENVARLDAFLGQARQAERLQKERKKSEVSAEQLLSLAISGWLLGSASAEMSVETAVRLWRGREMLLTYLRTEDEAKRRQLIQRHEAGSKIESASLDELAQILRTLPPVAAERKLPNDATEYKIEGATYYVQVPPEYRHTRPYPVIVVLHQADEKPTDLLQRWADAAAENGYILVAPEWQDGQNNKYTYSEAEHAIVLRTLRDLRWRFNTDEDRVFLTGVGEGGAMALDFGLGHPDLFAGVLPMGAGPQFHSELCWRNAQYLPIYLVHGSQAVDGSKVRDLFQNWVIYRHYSALWIDYKGRGAEWFGGELPNMFDWMRNKRRAFPMREVGTNGRGGQFGNEFCTQRNCDNHFYWLSCEIQPNYVKSLQNWRLRLRIPPAALDARIDPATNSIYVNTNAGIRAVTVWLGRNSKGEDMIDFDKAVNVYRNFVVVRPPNRKIVPSLEVLLEDFLQRGDRQQLFFAKIELR